MGGGVLLCTVPLPWPIHILKPVFIGGSDGIFGLGTVQSFFPAVGFADRLVWVDVGRSELLFY
jgi:hypothetical protein